MDRLPIAVWERNPYWVPELQRTLGMRGAQVATGRVAADMVRHVEQGARQLVIALPAGERWPFRLIEQWARRGVRVHVVLPSGGESWRWFLTELGAASVFDFEEARAHLVSACEGRCRSGVRRVESSPHVMRGLQQR